MTPILASFLMLPFLFISMLALFCSGLSLWRFLQATFVPLTKRDFWLPPCPFCWVARGLATVILVCVVVGA